MAALEKSEDEAVFKLQSRTEGVQQLYQQTGSAQVLDDIVCNFAQFVLEEELDTVISIRLGPVL